MSFSLWVQCLWFLRLFLPFCTRGTHAERQSFPDLLNQLSKPQGQLLQCLLGYSGFTATALQKEFCSLHEVPVSTYWYSLRALYRKHLILFQQGMPIQLTPEGKAIAQLIEEKTQGEMSVCPTNPKEIPIPAPLPSWPVPVRN